MANDLFSPSLTNLFDMYLRNAQRPNASIETQGPGRPRFSGDFGFTLPGGASLGVQGNYQPMPQGASTNNYLGLKYTRPF
jgi:hypothetical protein